MILRTICAVTSAVMIGMMLSGCGGTANSSAVNSDISSSVESVSDELVSVKTILEKIDDENLDAQAFIGDEIFKANSNNLYGKTQDYFADAGIIYASGGGLADEVSMLKMADGTSAKSILQARLESRSTTFETYKPEEMSKLEAAEIFQSGDYWVLVISDNKDTIKDTITEITG